MQQHTGYSRGRPDLTIWYLFRKIIYPLLPAPTNQITSSRTTEESSRMGVYPVTPGQIYLAPCFPRGHRCWEHCGGAPTRKWHKALLGFLRNRRGFIRGIPHFWLLCWEKTLSFGGRQSIDSWCACVREVHIAQGFRTECETNIPGGKLFSFHYQNSQIFTVHGLKKSILGTYWIFWWYKIKPLWLLNTANPSLSKAKSYYDL